MTSINISEDDFDRVANAACDALDRGDVASAKALDKIARKMNAALSNNRWGAKAVRMMGGAGKSISWREVPSVLETHRASAKAISQS